MTRERAIEVLDRWCGYGHPDEEYAKVGFEANINDVEEAHDMAIAALREQEERSKVVTQADRIRSMSDDELAKWMAERYANQKCVEAEQRDETLTATQISAAFQTCYCILRRWFKQPYVKEDD